MLKIRKWQVCTPSPNRKRNIHEVFASQVVLYGNNSGHNVALIVPNFTIVRTRSCLSDDTSEENVTNNVLQ